MGGKFAYIIDATKESIFIEETIQFKSFISEHDKAMIMIMRAFLGLNFTDLVSRRLSQQTLQQINSLIS